ncbi:MAG TPA: late competence development ComFB family protein [Spirochaetia bacterium]|nr:late competence development ComFB family protein [Spirochaetia bacterium]
MKLKNYQEDVVLRAIEIALEDQPELLSDESFVNDVAAYVLNRIPPRYVMSERGFLRLALEHLDDSEHDRSLANVIELMLLVNRGVELVGSRRSEPSVSREAVRDEGLAADPGVEYLHNYPQIIGKVVDAETGEPVSGARVMMHVDGDLVPPAANGWQNPCVTQEQTRGHFSFWPRSTRSVEQELSAEVLFTVEHPDYAEFRSVSRIRTEGEFGPQQTIRGDKIVSLAPFALVPATALSSEGS